MTDVDEAGVVRGAEEVGIEAEVEEEEEVVGGVYVDEVDVHDVVGVEEVVGVHVVVGVQTVVGSGVQVVEVVVGVQLVDVEVVLPLLNHHDP